MIRKNTSKLTHTKGNEVSSKLVNVATFVLALQIKIELEYLAGKKDVQNCRCCSRFFSTSTTAEIKKYTVIS